VNVRVIVYCHEPGCAEGVGIEIAVGARPASEVISTDEARRALRAAVDALGWRDDRCPRHA